MVRYLSNVNISTAATGFSDGSVFNEREDMHSAATGIGTCSMGCSYCDARKEYEIMADRHAKGETYAAIAQSLGVTPQYIFQSVRKAKEYGWKP
jgi:DNA repair photolyase